jgi:hypothetical protein
MDFGAGDANLYRYVGNAPSSATDPLGLQAAADVQDINSGWELRFDKGKYPTKKVDEKLLTGNPFKYRDAVGTVAVWADAAARRPATKQDAVNCIWIQFTTNGTTVSKCTHCLQFVWRYWVDAKTGKRLDPYYYESVKPGREQGVVKGKGQKNLFHWGNEKGQHVDNSNWTDIYYDSSGGAHRRTDRELSIFDFPSLDFEDEYSEVGFVGDSFLVDSEKNTVYYHVHWERVSKKGDDGNWSHPTYTVRGSAADKLPAWAGKSLSVDFRSDKGGMLQDEHALPNPYPFEKG